MYTSLAALSKIKLFSVGALKRKAGRASGTVFCCKALAYPTLFVLSLCLVFT